MMRQFKTGVRKGPAKERREYDDDLTLRTLHQTPRGTRVRTSHTWNEDDSLLLFIGQLRKAIGTYLTMAPGHSDCATISWPNHGMWECPVAPNSR